MCEVGTSLIVLYRDVRTIEKDWRQNAVSVIAAGGPVDCIVICYNFVGNIAQVNSTHGVTSRASVLLSNCSSSEPSFTAQNVVFCCGCILQPLLTPVPLSSTFKMKMIRSSEMSVHTRFTRRHIPEDGIFHSHRRENLKSYITYVCSKFRVIIQQLNGPLVTTVWHVLRSRRLQLQKVIGGAFEPIMARNATQCFELGLIQQLNGPLVTTVWHVLRSRRLQLQKVIGGAFEPIMVRNATQCFELGRVVSSWREIWNLECEQTGRKTHWKGSWKIYAWITE
jgi:hypothetical protein